MMNDEYGYEYDDDEYELYEYDDVYEYDSDDEYELYEYMYEY